MALPAGRELLRALADPVRFAQVLCGAELWDHQIAVARSSARYRIICSGRQAGKSRLLAILALFQGFTKPGSLTLVVSAGETAAKRLLEEIATLASAEILAPSVVEDNQTILVLSNGSRIMSVPASQKQIRGWPVDLLILDEAGFIENDIWRAAEPAIIARPGSRVILCSSPWGGVEAFFRQLWQRGMDSPDAMYESWHWPSSISPMVDDKLLEEIRKRETADYFTREFLAEWQDEYGAYLTEEEISSAASGYRLASPQMVSGWSPWDPYSQRKERPYTAVSGVDWAFSRDANAQVLMAALDDGGLNPGAEHRYFVPWMEFAYKTPYSKWVTTVADTAKGYGLRVVASEANGVGAAPTQSLQDEMGRRATGCFVAAVWTDARRKMSGFGQIKMMLQQGLLVLPREPELLKQLRSLEFENLPGGGVRIAVPERAGHDDLAMALMQAVSCIRPTTRGEGEIPDRGALPHDTTGSGVKVPLQPRPVQWHSMSYAAPAGREREPASAW